jgi:uncharacterized membrane protein
LTAILLIALFLPPAIQGFFFISGKASVILSGLFNINILPPAYTNLGQNGTGHPMLVYAKWSGNGMLDSAWLATNETGMWENKSAYGSPVKMNSFSGWSNFTWVNPSFQGTVYWKIYANDTAGNVNSTEVMSFHVVPETQAAQTGGGGASHVYSRNFTVDKEFIKASIKQGETALEYFIIKNTGETALDFNITVKNLEKNIMLSDDAFILQLGESETISVAFTSMEDTNPDIYTGKIVVNAGGITRQVMLIMEVKPRKSLFDVYVNLPETLYTVIPGQEIDADILLYNFGDIKPVDVILYYSLRDFDGKDILISHETIAVYDQKLVKRKIAVPTELENGYYQFYAKIVYGNQTATSAGLVKVVSKVPPQISQEAFNADYLLIALISVIMITALLYFARKKYGQVSKVPKKTERKTERAESAAKISKMKESVDNPGSMLKINNVAEGAEKGLDWVEEETEKLKSNLKALVSDRYFEKEIITVMGGQKKVEIAFRNDGKSGVNASLYVDGLPPEWLYSVWPSSVYVQSGEDAAFNVRFMIPLNANKNKYGFNYVVKMDGHMITEPAIVVVVGTKKEALDMELQKIAKKISQVSKHYGKSRMKIIGTFL